MEIASRNHWSISTAVCYSWWSYWSWPEETRKMWFCCTLARHNSLMWMKPESISSLTVIGTWRTSHRHEQHFCNMQSVPLTKQDISGVRHSRPIQHFQVLPSGVGNWTVSKSECLYGLSCQRHQRAAENLLRVHVKNGAQEDASVLKQASRVHSCVSVVDNV